MTTYVYIIRVDAVGQEGLEALIKSKEMKSHVKQVICSVPEYTLGSSGASGDAYRPSIINSVVLRDDSLCKCPDLLHCQEYGCLRSKQRLMPKSFRPEQSDDGKA